MSIAEIKLSTSVSPDVQPRPDRGSLLLSARGVGKEFPGIRALHAVDIDLVAGEVHGLVGENGAGKSTLAKVLSGVVEPDSGTISVAGQRVARFDPRAARRAGIAVIHQEPHIVPALSPVANVFLGQAVSRAGLLSEAEMRRRFLNWTAYLGINLPTSGSTGVLSIAAQQMIEIIRAFEQDARIVIMDEPTASLGTEDRIGLFKTIDALLLRGSAIVYISHKLEDVLRIAHTISVLRDGQKVMTSRSSDTDVDSLVQAMLDDDLKDALHQRPQASAAPRREALRIASLSTGRLSDVNFSISTGEIVGIAGLVGAGRSTLLRALGGAERPEEGLFFLEGTQVPWPRSPRHAHRCGVVLAPEDRRTEGLIMGLPGWDNVALPTLALRSRLGFTSQRRLREATGQEVVKVDFSPKRLGVAVKNLSGGNQQKLVLGKLLPLLPKVLLVDEPTRGVDIGAKVEIFALLRNLASEGTAVVIVSEEIEELVAVADRIVVLRDGRVVDVVASTTMDSNRILRAMLPTNHQDPSGSLPYQNPFPTKGTA